jgi:two-component system nitrogen regulation sensor histidine kinase NtrY
VNELAARFSRWSREADLARRLELALTIAVFVSSTATFAALTRTGPLGGPNPRTVFTLLVLDLLLILPLTALIGRRLATVWAERRAGVAGARLHVRLVMMFSTVAITPTILVAVFSGVLINIGVEQWFSTRVRTALDESLAVANAYFEEHQQVIRGDAMAMANDINREGLVVVTNPSWLNQLVAGQAAARGLTEAIVFDSSGRILARTGLAFSMEMSLDRLPQSAVSQAKSHEVAVLTNPDDQRMRALVQLDTGLTDTFLYIGRFIDPKVLDHMERTNRAVEEYQKLEGTRSGLEITFSAIFAVVALLLLLGAIWVGLTLATRLATPIIKLIDAAERVRAGDLTARVEETDSTDELGSLSRAFNRMTSQLATQRTDLMDVNRQLDERRRFTETVLAGVSAGVIGLDRDGYVELPNRTALDYLAVDPEAMIGGPFTDIVPEAAALLRAAEDRPEKPVQDEVTIFRDGRARTLLMRVVAERAGPLVTGYVVTLDDITALLAAQRQAAWADVARRIAHEIKNPLTPIQLSAERLKRRYLKQVDQNDKETFIACTDTIVRQVGDIGRMVDEFSAFARMPQPVMKSEDLKTMATQAVFLARTGYPDVEFVTTLPQQEARLPCDARQIGQALTNLLKNAVEATLPSEEESETPQRKGKVAVTLFERQGCWTISVEDNGRGLPEAMRDRLTEPYVTTRSKGTGLGLAIVKKIMEDHGGEVVLEDREGGGAKVSLIFRPMEFDDAVSSINDGA